MADPRGFLNIEQQKPTPRPVHQRIKDYRELYQPMPAESIRAQASRCMDCGVPFCHTGCPLGNLIPDWNDLVHRNRWEEALGRCTTPTTSPSSPARPARPRASRRASWPSAASPVTIKNIEMAIVDKGWEMGWISADAARASRPASGWRSSAADRRGWPPPSSSAGPVMRSPSTSATTGPGGLMTYGIPDFKMAKHYVERRIEQMEAEGVRFLVNADVGRHDRPGRRPGPPRRRAPDRRRRPGRATSTSPAAGSRGSRLAMPFLTQQNRRGLGDSFNGEPILATGKNVIIIGGGDTAADCLGTCHRQQARSVLQLDYNPRPPENENPETPWPLWPKILRISPAHEEGGKRDWQIKTKQFVGDERGHVKELHAVRVQQYFDEAGERQFEEIHGTELIFPCELVLLAIGFSGPEPVLPNARST